MYSYIRANFGVAACMFVRVSFWLCIPPFFLECSRLFRRLPVILLFRERFETPPPVLFQHAQLTVRHTADVVVAYDTTHT